METTTLRWFLAVADGATVSAVAAAHHTTQPAVSRGLARLAGELGTPLLERRGRRLHPTPAGRIAAEGARRTLAELDTLDRALAEADDPDHGTVRLGFLNPLGTWLIPSLLTAFHEDHAAVDFQLRPEGAARNLAALAAGELDLVLGEATAEPGDDPALSFEPLFEEELRLLVPAAHRLAARRRVRAAELAGERWVVQPEGYGLRRRAEALCARGGFEPHRAFEGHDLVTLFALIGAGSGIGLFPARPAPGPGVVALALDPAERRTVGLVTRTGRAIPAAATAFAEVVRRRAPGLA